MPAPLRPAIRPRIYVAVHTTLVAAVAEAQLQRVDNAAFQGRKLVGSGETVKGGVHAFWSRVGWAYDVATRILLTAGPEILLPTPPQAKKRSRLGCKLFGLFNDRYTACSAFALKSLRLNDLRQAASDGARGGFDWLNRT